MLSFKKFIAEEEVKATTREGIEHLQKMKDIEFIDFFTKIKKELKGKLTNVPVQLKVDLLGFRFGKDSTGNIFVESSRSGPIYDEGSFTKHTMSRGSADSIMIERAQHYDDILKYFKNANISKILPNNTKVVVEVGYNPMADQKDDWITFVTVKYDKSKLGSLMTLFPHKVLVASTGDKHPQEKEILNSLYKLSTSQIKILNPYLQTSDIDISGYLDPLDSIDARTKEVLLSRKAADKPEKAAIKELLQKIKDNLADYILHHPAIKGKEMIGSDIEGLILNISGKDIKVTTPEFKLSKAKS
jgi:hypothetical protein